MVCLPRSLNRRRWLLATASVFGAAAGVVAKRARAAEPVAPQEAPGIASPALPAPALPPRAIADLGVELMGVRLSASDFLIDLRYRIKDVNKAQALVERKVQPVLVNEATGDRYYIPQAPKVGSLKQSATSKQPAIVDRVYFMLFANPDRKLKSGEKVTLYAGDSVVHDIIVEG